MQYLAKILLTAVAVVIVAELAKRNSVFAALVASLPLTSLLAFVWLYLDTHDALHVADLSADIFWLVIPSLALFLALPALLRAGWGFWTSLMLSSAVTALCYGLMFAARRALTGA